MLPVEGDGVGDARRRARCWHASPTAAAIRSLPVWNEPMSMRACSAGHGDELTPAADPAAATTVSAISARLWVDGVPDVEHPPTARSSVAAAIARDDVVDVQAVAALRAVAVDEDLLVEQGTPEEHRAGSRARRW